MKALAVLAYQYGMANAGDFAITLGAVDFLLEHYEKIMLISKCTEEQKEFSEARLYLAEHYGDRVELFPGPFFLDRNGIRSLLKSYTRGVFNLFSPAVAEKYMAFMHHADDVYINGGNLLRCTSITDYIRLKALLYPAALAYKHAIPVTFLPQSTTEITGIGRRMIYTALKRAKAVYIREAVSCRYLTEVYPDIPFQQSMDMAFYIRENPKAEDDFKQRYGWLAESNHSTVAITLRKERIGDIGELGDKERKLIQEKIKSLIERLHREHSSILIVVQTAKDLEFSEEVLCRAKQENEAIDIRLVEEHDPLVLRELYKSVELLIGMRLHSIILAASVGTPIVGLFSHEWGKKNPGVMDELEMPYRFLEGEVDWEQLMGQGMKKKSNMADAIKRGRTLEA